MEKKNYIVGIDIGSSNIVLVVGSKNESGEMVVEILVERPSKGVNAGMIENINQVSECLKEVRTEAEERLGIRISEAYAGVSGAFIRCTPLSDHVYVRDPRNGISQSDVDALFLRMKEVVAPENEVILERLPQKYTVDGHKEVLDPVGAFGHRLVATFNFILCEKTPLERLSMAFRHSGMTLAGFFANPMIMSNALLTEDEKVEGVAVVDIGGSTTDVAVYHGNILRHIASIPMGASSINKDINMFGVPERSVESLKKKYGSAIAEFVSDQKFIQIPSMGHRSKGVLRRNLVAIIEARLTDIAEFVKAAIKESGYAGRLTYGVILTGGSASIEHIDELFHRVTGFDVRVATAKEGLDEGSQSGIEFPEHTAAVALLLKGAEKGACSVVSRPTVATPMGFTAPTHTPEPVTPRRPEPMGVNVEKQPEIARPEPVKEPKPEEKPETKPEPTKRSKPWVKFGNMFKKLTDGINDAFDNGDDEDL